MRFFRSYLALIIIFVFAISSYSNPTKQKANNSKKNPIIAKAGTVAPADTPWAVWISQVQKRWQKESNNALKVKLYLGGKLGGEKEIIEETKRGTIQVFGGSVGAMAAQYVPELNVFELPFLFESDEEVDYVLNKMRPQVKKLLDERGFIFSMWSENGWHGFASKEKCIDEPKDLKGLRMRSQESAIHLGTYKSLGATPVSIPVPEVLTALDVGVVDGFSNTPLFAFASGWFRPVKHFTYTRHIYQPGLIAVSKKWFNTLPAKIQKIILNPKEEKSGLKSIRALTQPLLSNFKAVGVNVCDIKAKQRKIFAKQVKPVWKNFAKKNKGSKKMLEAVLVHKKEFKQLKS